MGTHHATLQSKIIKFWSLKRPRAQGSRGEVAGLGGCGSGGALAVKSAKSGPMDTLIGEVPYSWIVLDEIIRSEGSMIHGVRSISFFGPNKRDESVSTLASLNNMSEYWDKGPCSLGIVLRNVELVGPVQAAAIFSLTERKPQVWHNQFIQQSTDQPK